MTKPVLQADFATWRPVQGRKVLQLIFEVPIENTEHVLKILGVPNPGDSKWCEIKLLQPEAEGQVSEANGSHKKWNEYTRSQQAAILCSDPEFQRYFSGGGSELMTKEMLRRQLRIESRKELDKPENHARWDEFVAIYNMKRPK